MYELNDRVFLVTGAAGAIGPAIGEALLAAGARVLLVDLDGDGAKDAAVRLDPKGARAIGSAVNVTVPAEAKDAVDAALDAFGRLDGLVNNAGTLSMNAAEDATAEEWQHHFNVNATGAFVMAQAAVTVMRARSGGRIVNVASNCGKVGYRNMAAYNASKAALISMTRSLASEWMEVGINVNAVCPGGVDTPMLGRVANWLSERLGEDPSILLEDMGSEQMGRRIAPIEVGRIVAFLLSDHAEIIRGQAINVDGGDTPY
ncbi:MAG: SDR family NAD(P)-dependent oxidoreductase [Pseudomonadota bacterium]|nr:SDR family NAD(P)-dependent oxidoreductase [Pseudomonadota bacterium]